MLPISVKENRWQIIILLRHIYPSVQLGDTPINSFRDTTIRATRYSARATMQLHFHTRYNNTPNTEETASFQGVVGNKVNLVAATDILISRRANPLHTCLPNKECFMLLRLFSFFIMTSLSHAI